jgi:hypothetical protein
MAEIYPVKLRNDMIVPFISSVKLDRPDKELVFKQTRILPKKEVIFDGNNPTVRIFAKAGKLTPANKTAQQWVEGL